MLQDMKIFQYRQQRLTKSLGTGVAAMFLGVASGSAQLAITEVMSRAIETSVGGQPLNSDWWELTNFGTNAIDLNDYYWTDSGDTPLLYSFQGLVIGPGKSVIVFRSNETPDEAAFREWWDGCLGPSLQEIRSWDWPGLDHKVGDSVRLYDTQGRLVDGVHFGLAQPGTTFVSDPVTGDFGVYSKLGECGTCQAAKTGDIGSPGTHCDSMPLGILEQPSSVQAWPGLDAIFSVRSCGLPRARYQWLFNGTNIPGAIGPSLVIADPESSDEGEYQVVLNNGLGTVASTNVSLILKTNPSPPKLLQELSDVEVFVGENARFSVFAGAVPRPQFQWESNSIGIVGATNRTLEIPNAAIEISGTLFSVRIWNENGLTNASARLLVSPQPCLAITEAMPAPSINPNCPVVRANWWELTNLGTNTVHIKGFRHVDRALISGAKTVTNNVIIQSGESVIFVDQLTRDEFISWWGKTNLPPDLQVITYGGYGLDRWSETIHVWSAAGSLLTSVSYASPTPFPGEPPLCPCYLGDPPNPMCGYPIYGHTLFFSPEAVKGQGSEENENGAFRAEACDDVGSPGFCVLPRFFGFNRNGSTITLRWRAVKGKRYRIEWRPDVDAGLWATDGRIHTALGSTVESIVTPPPGTMQRFYRLREMP